MSVNKWFNLVLCFIFYHAAVIIGSESCVALGNVFRDRWRRLGLRFLEFYENSLPVCVYTYSFANIIHFYTVFTILSAAFDGTRPPSGFFNSRETFLLYPHLFLATKYTALGVSFWNLHVTISYDYFNTHGGMFFDT